MEREKPLYVLGGIGNGSCRLKEVQEYSLTKNIRRAHSQLLETVCSSSAVVLNQVIYNIGGHESSHSVVWKRLSGTYLSNWKIIE